MNAVVILTLHATTGIFCLVSVDVVIVLTLHVPGRLDLIVNGTLAMKYFSCLVVLFVINQLNTIIAAMINVMILFMRIPFGIKHELLYPKEILILAKVIINLIRLYRTGLSPHQFSESGKLLVKSFVDLAL